MPPIRVGTASWTGTSLWPLFERAGLNDDAVEIVFSGADHGFHKDDEHDYQRALTIDEVKRPEVMLVYAMNDRPLEPQNGFPLRLLVPGWYGMTSVKWLERITVLDRPFEGFQMAKRYRLQRDTHGLDLSRHRIVGAELRFTIQAEHV